MEDNLRFLEENAKFLQQNTQFLNNNSRHLQESLEKLKENQEQLRKTEETCSKVKEYLHKMDSFGSQDELTPMEKKEFEEVLKKFNLYPKIFPSRIFARGNCSNCQRRITPADLVNGSYFKFFTGEKLEADRYFISDQAPTRQSIFGKCLNCGFTIPMGYFHEKYGCF